MLHIKGWLNVCRNIQTKIASASTTLASSTATIKANGDATRSLTQRMGGLASKFTSWLTVSQAVMYSVQAIRNMVTASIELDTAMTELKRSQTSQTPHTIDSWKTHQLAPRSLAHPCLIS